MTLSAHLQARIKGFLFVLYAMDELFGVIALGVADFASSDHKYDRNVLRINGFRVL